MRIPAALLTAVLLPLTLAGCGSATTATDPPTTSPSAHDTGSAAPAESTVPPASGRRLAAGGVSFSVPRGWADVTEESGGAMVLMAADLGGGDELPAMLTVERRAAPAGSVSVLERRASRSLEQQGAHRISVRPSLEVAGRPAAHLSAVSSMRGAQLGVDRYAVQVGPATWTITYAANRWLVRADRVRTIESILASWRWE